MRAYCINLDRRTDRLEQVTMEFKRAGLPFERITAVDAKDPAVAAAAETVPLSFQHVRISAGAYACLQSHRRAWRRMLDDGQAYGAFFEDDVLLAPDISFLGEDQWVPADAEVVKLETFQTRVHLSRHRHRIAPAWSLARLRSTHIGTAAYVLRADTAERLLVLTERRGDPVDELVFNSKLGFFDSAMIYQMIPAPAAQGDRLGPQKLKVDVGWKATSITTRHAAGQVAVQDVPERIFARFYRRLREELCAVRNGTRYVVVAHGRSLD